MGGGNPNRTTKNIALLMLVVIMGLLTYELFQSEQGKIQEVAYSRFLKLLETKQVMTTEKEPLLIQGPLISGKFKNEKSEEISFKTYMPYPDDRLLPLLQEKEVKFFKGAPLEENFFWRSLFSFLPWIAIVAVLWFMMARQI